MKKLSEIIRKPKAKRKFSIFEMDFSPSRIEIAKKCNDIRKNIDVTLDNFCVYAKKNKAAIYDVYDLREDFEVKKVLFNLNSVECEIKADEEAGMITIFAHPRPADDTGSENNLVEYLSAKNEPLRAGTFRYSEKDAAKYGLTLSCAERPLTSEELEWGCNAVYGVSACINDIYDISIGRVPRSALRRSTYKAEEFTPVSRRLSKKTQQNIKRAEAMVKSFSVNLPQEYTGVKERKAERGELLCTQVCIEGKSYEETIYLHDQMLTVVCTSNLDNERGLYNGKVGLCLEENCVPKKYEVKFDDNGKLCICAHIPICSIVPAEEKFRQLLEQLHDYAGSFVQKYESWKPRVTVPQNDDDDICLCDDDIDFEECFGRGFKSSKAAEEAEESFNSMFNIFNARIDEGEKSYAKPPVVLTDDVPDDLPF